MEKSIENQYLRTQLVERKHKLEMAMAASSGDASLAELGAQVDVALDRMEKGTYGICEECHEPVEQERLLANPLECYCLDHLTAPQRRALEDDLTLAARIQRSLLPPADLLHAGWQVHYHYEPASVVSGDYCDLIRPENGAGDLLFLVGDVAGKGVAASMLMTHLHAMFRSLATVGLPLSELMALANRVFCESAMAGQYATLICGRARPTGEVELSSAGHLPALWVRRGAVTSIEATGLPLGMFCTGSYPSRKIRLDPGESLFLFTDGVSETRNAADTEYGMKRLAEMVGAKHALAPNELTAACLRELRAYDGGHAPADDRTILVLNRAG
ncbi:MAG TPA: SpoIIE family protein phosphatase [Candidatus Acidoferrales bacterium]|nr:SpoIIE family protein phosphatase [Candidatus Acidoferrales bacterium]